MSRNQLLVRLSRSKLKMKMTQKRVLERAFKYLVKIKRIVPPKLSSRLI